MAYPASVEPQESLGVGSLPIMARNRYGTTSILGSDNASICSACLWIKNNFFWCSCQAGRPATFRLHICSGKVKSRQQSRSRNGDNAATLYLEERLCRTSGSGIMGRRGKLLDRGRRKISFQHLTIPGVPDFSHS